MQATEEALSRVTVGHVTETLRTLVIVRGFLLCGSREGRVGYGEGPVVNAGKGRRLPGYVRSRGVPGVSCSRVGPS